MQAAEILDVSIQRVKQLLEKDFLPYAGHASGARLMRREQLLTVANAAVAEGSVNEASGAAAPHRLRATQGGR